MTKSKKTFIEDYGLEEGMKKYNRCLEMRTKRYIPQDAAGKAHTAEYGKTRYEAKKPEILAKQKQHYEDNIDEKHVQQAELRATDGYSDKMKAYHKSPTGRKSGMITKWKQRGVVLPVGHTWDSLHDLYKNTTACMVCKKVFRDSNDKCLDHCHESGAYRQVLCCSCNNYDSWKHKNKSPAIYMLRGHEKSSPYIHIYGFFDTIDDCLGRIDQLDKHIISNTGQLLDNVIHTKSHVFWYEKFDDQTCMDTAVSNSP